MTRQKDASTVRGVTGGSRGRGRELPPLDGPRLGAELAGPAQAEALQACLDGASEYFTRTEGAPAAPDRALQLLADAEADPARRVYLLVPHAGGPAVGMLDLTFEPSDPGTVHVGLLLFRESCQGIGYGAETVAELLRALVEAGYRAVRATVGDESPEARVFWEREGFFEVGRLTGGVTVFERSLA